MSAEAGFTGSKAKQFQAISHMNRWRFEVVLQASLFSVLSAVRLALILPATPPAVGRCLIAVSESCCCAASGPQQALSRGHCPIHAGHGRAPISTSDRDPLHRAFHTMLLFHIYSQRIQNFLHHLLLSQPPLDGVPENPVSIYPSIPLADPGGITS